jgi:hypothetical protein
MHDADLVQPVGEDGSRVAPEFAQSTRTVWDSNQ